MLYYRTFYQYNCIKIVAAFLTEKHLEETNCDAQQNTPVSPECKVNDNFIKCDMVHQVKLDIWSEIFSTVVFNVFVSSPVSLKM